MSNNIYYLERERNKYYNLRQDIKNICTNLSRCSTTINRAAAALERDYRIDEVVADNERLKGVYKNINSIRNSLNGMVISAINYQISQLNVKIARERQKANSQ